MRIDAKAKAVGTVLLVAAAALAWDWWQQGGSPSPAPAAVPALPHEVSALIDPEKPRTVVHAWATWCPPCMAEMPGLLAEAKAGRKGVALVLISADTSATVLDAFYRRNGINPADTRTATWLHDPAQALIGQLDPGRAVLLPFTAAYTREGRVVQTIRGRVAWTPLLNALER